MITKSGRALHAEAGTLANLFSLKGVLDTSNNLTYPSLKRIAAPDVGSAKIGPRVLLYSVREHEAPSLSYFIHQTETSLTTNQVAGPGLKKLKLTEQYFNHFSSGFFEKEGLESATESTLDFANASRWLIKASPLSEDLTTSNSFFTNAKYAMGENALNSGAPNDNVWLSNYSSTDLLNKSHLLNLNTTAAGVLSSNLDDFEASRLWNQKRSFYTTLLNSSFTREHLVLSRTDSKQVRNASDTYFSVLSSSISLSYVGTKDEFGYNSFSSFDKAKTPVLRANFFFTTNDNLNN